MTKYGPEFLKFNATAMGMRLLQVELGYSSKNVDLKKGNFRNWQDLTNWIL